MKRFFLLISILLAGITAQAATGKTVHVAEAGTLPDYISDAEKYTIEELTITGYLNGTDFKLIRDMAGGQSSAGQMKKLDIAEATIVAGGQKYYDNFNIQTPNEISQRLLMDCVKLEQLILPNNITAIGEDALANCSALRSIVIPASVTTIGGSAFMSCEALTSVTLPEELTVIGRYAFAYCKQLATVTFGNKVTTIRDAAFYECQRLDGIILPNSLTSIESQPFEGCTSLQTVTIPENVNTIWGRPFARCTSLKEIKVAQGNSSYHSVDGVLYDINNLYLIQYPAGRDATEYTVPDGIREIGSGAFSGSKKLVRIELPEGLNSLNGSSFYGCAALQEITLPSSISQFWYGEFNGCTALQKVTSNIEDPTAVSYYPYEPYESNLALLFSEETYASAKLYVPTGKKALYEQTDNWKQFQHIEEQPTESVTITANSYTRQYGEANPAFAFTTAGTALSGTPVVSCEATATSPVGTYPITVSQGSVSNANVTYVNGTLTITKAPLTIAADNKTMKPGEAVPELTVSYSGFKNNEDASVLTVPPTVTTTATAQSTPGTYPITVSGGEAHNYALSYKNGTLTVENHTGYVLVVLLQNGEQQKYMLTDKPHAQFSGSQLRINTSQAAITYNRQDVKTFYFAQAGSSFEPVLLTAGSYTREYGEANPAFGYTAEGGTANGTPSISTTADELSPVGEYPVLISRGGIDNDNATFVSGTLTITKAPLTVTADDQVMTQGDALPDLTVSYSGFKNNEDENVLTTQPTASTTANSQSSAGEYVITVTGGKATNYAFVYENGTLTINEPERTGHVLVVHLGNGDTERYQLTEQPRAAFTGSSLTISTATLTSTYKRSEIVEFTFEEDATAGIQELEEQTELTIRQTAEGQLAIGGLEHGQAVKVYGIGGQLLQQYKTVAGQATNITLPGQKGIYIINIANKRTIKIQRK